MKEIIKKLFPKTYQAYKLSSLRKEHARLLEEAEKSVVESDEEIAAVIKKVYDSRMGHELNLSDPKMFTEKIQWRKVYDVDPIYSLLSDKYAVREWVEKKIGKEYLIPLLGVWENADDIDISSLPDKFVLKTNNGSATNLLVTDKTKVDEKIIKENYSYFLKFPYSTIYQERHYDRIKPLVIAEELMEGDGPDLTDYKFYCFDGNPKYCEVITNRFHGECIDLFDMEWNHMEYGGEAFDSKVPLKKPQLWDRMVEMAKCLSQGFAYVRVDLYFIKEKIYFGEMTFTPAGGYDTDLPEKWEYTFGELWDITKPQIDKAKVGAGIDN